MKTLTPKIFPAFTPEEAQVIFDVLVDNIDEFVDTCDDEDVDNILVLNKLQELAGINSNEDQSNS